MPKRSIVLRRHLAEGEGWETSEFEFGLIIAFNAFSRWMVKCMAAVGHTEMSPLEILLLHNVNHRGRDKRLADICSLLNTEDTQTVNYALRKLSKAGLISAEKRGKEVFYRASPSGAGLCDAYHDIRTRCPLEGPTRMGTSGDDLSDIGATLRALSRQYDQASRAAASL